MAGRHLLLLEGSPLVDQSRELGSEAGLGGVNLRERRPESSVSLPRLVNTRDVGGSLLPVWRRNMHSASRSSSIRSGTRKRTRQEGGARNALDVSDLMLQVLDRLLQFCAAGYGERKQSQSLRGSDPWKARETILSSRLTDLQTSVDKVLWEIERVVPVSVER